MKRVVLDIETYDPWIKEGRGSGWPEKKAKFLCACTRDYLGVEKSFTDVEQLKDYLIQYDLILAHNATYEMGIMWSYGFDIESVQWGCTRILAILFNNELMDYTLDGLAKRYLNKGKTDVLLGEEATKQGLARRGKNPIRAAKENMEAIYESIPEVVIDYCHQDVLLTDELYIHLIDTQPDLYDTIEFHSDLMKALTLSRSRGVRVDTSVAVELYNKFLPEYKEAKAIIELIAPGLNTASPKQMIRFFEDEGVKFTRFNKKTNSPKVDTEFLQELDHPLAKAVIREKKLKKLVTNYIEPILSLARPDIEQETLSYNVDIDLPDIIMVYPEIRIYGAAATGRASCTGPNLQQVPKRTEEGAQIRRMYKPAPGEKWYSLDFSAQEIRMIVHYGVITKCEGAIDVATRYNTDPSYDMHQAVADALKIDRKDGKTLNLGLAYGMSTPRLAAILGLTSWRAAKLKDQVRGLVPFLAELDFQCKYVIRERGYIRTSGNRRLYNEEGGERKATNKVIQGSSADQTWKALVDCYRAGIHVLFPIHDSIEISTSDIEVVKKVKHYMEYGLTLKVPSQASVEGGNSWGELEEIVL